MMEDILPKRANISVSHKVFSALKSAFSSWVNFSIPIFLLIIGVLIGTIVGTIVAEQYYKSQFTLVPKTGVKAIPTGRNSLAEVLASDEMKRKINEK